LRTSILRRIPRSETIGFGSGFETAGLASAATLVGILWIGVTVPTLSPLHGSRAGADRSISIALESALLGIDDGSGRSFRAAALADRLGVVPSGRLLPTPEGLRTRAAELAARVSSNRVVAGRGGVLTIALREPLIVTGAEPGPPAGGHDERTLSLPAPPPPPAPAPERVPAPPPAPPPAPQARAQTDAPPPRPNRPEAATTPGTGASQSDSVVDGPVATRPALLHDDGVDDSSGTPATDPAGPAAAGPEQVGAGQRVDGETGPGQAAPDAAAAVPAPADPSSGEPVSDVAGAPAPVTPGPGNGVANGSGGNGGSGNAAGQGNGHGNGNAVGQGNGAPNGQAVGQGGASNGNGYGHTK
jgi:hypothetical protein